MKFVGDKAVFAIEYDLQMVDGIYYFGDLWFWIDGKQVGTKETQTVPYLSSSVSYLKDFMNRKEYRRFLGSEKFNAEQMFFILFERFYSTTLPVGNDLQEASAFRENFNLESIGQESFFDTVQIVMIDEPAMKRQRFL